MKVLLPRMFYELLFAIEHESWTDFLSIRDSELVAQLKGQQNFRS